MAVDGLIKWTTSSAESGKNLVSKIQNQRADAGQTAEPVSRDQYGSIGT